MQHEAIVDYVSRLVNCEKFYDRSDTGVYEFQPIIMGKINDELKTHDHTYYFSIVTSYRGTRVMNKAKEFLQEPAKTVTLGLGFDPEVNTQIRYTGHTSLKEVKIKRRKEGISWVQRQYLKLKYWFNPLNIMSTISWESFMDYRPPKMEQRNLNNPHMNEIGAIDYHNRDWTQDHDCLITRYS